MKSCPEPTMTHDAPCRTSFPSYMRARAYRGFYGKCVMVRHVRHGVEGEGRASDFAPATNSRRFLTLYL
jgi:hypothetical protein